MVVNTLAGITNLNFAYTLDQLSLTELIEQLPEEPSTILYVWRACL
ncbi:MULTISPECIES: hypothetical protein [Tetragenococcus]|uniref:Uncharacterized protein n=3 Tax=Tetragenococcus TaxID=51668 RepID=A0A091CE16_9ENTE|nr:MULTISPECIES: hypothetical protein [Tetragenococcus]KFN92623.1 hypothetical protein TMU3MR103_0376 [Tetragenococcus muriaticus 3MR10-3]KFN93347.1 hypothetical protein TMUPMC115_0472 [Tetragenococcus muriaticus PMC-11-5]GMA52973.1 hypothetical protein GCM10025857_43300 [Alicyclobacillus contaminans]GMA73040.1 hypothetical protein GCM10025885_20890 [Tetragenococcus osmophilus]